jgi:hypothetical protein
MSYYLPMCSVLNVAVFQDVYLPKLCMHLCLLILAVCPLQSPRFHYNSCIHEETKTRLNSGNAYYHYVQNILSSRLLYKNRKTEICATIILPVVLYERETWHRTSREQHRVRVSETRALRRIFRHLREEVLGDWRRLYNEELHKLYASTHIIIVTKPRRM